MKKGFVALIFLSVFSPTVLSHSNETVTCKVTPVFPGEQSLAGAVIKEIRQTRLQLLLALYGFNNRDISEELEKLARRGVGVKIKIDADKAGEKRERRIIEALKAAGVPVQAVAPEGRNHNKFAVIDGTKVITGSYNWTLKAESNWENLLILDCPKLAERYAAEWEKIH